VSMSSDGFFGQQMLAMMDPRAISQYLAASVLMWITMMLAMMIPAVLPVIHMFWRLERGGDSQSVTHGVLFGASYLVVWSACGIALAGVQWWLHAHALLQLPAMATEQRLAAALLIASGVYQLTPFKAACLAHCQSPVGFLMSHWRAGATGALRMGLAHGVYCLGCCWALMLTMFAGGVMNIAVMFAISALILLERLLPVGPWISKVPGVILILLGLSLLAK